MFKVIFFLLFAHLIISTIYSFKVSSIDETEIDFQDFRGKKILIVNTATGSSFLPQLLSLENLYEKHKDSLVVIAIPSNSFGNEMSDASSIKTLMRERYGAHYLIANKMQVAGQNASALYQWLTTVAGNGVMNSEVKGDFQKYLIGSDGRLMGYFNPGILPTDSVVIKAIENKLVSH